MARVSAENRRDLTTVRVWSLSGDWTLIIPLSGVGRKALLQLTLTLENSVRLIGWVEGAC